MLLSKKYVTLGIMVRGPRVWPMSEEQNAAAPIQNDSETIPARLPRQRQFNNHQPPSSGWLPPLCAGILIEPSTRSCGEFFLTRGKRHPLILITIACCFCRFVAFAAEPSVQAPTGLWDGSMQSRVGEVSFGIDLKAQGTHCLSHAGQCDRPSAIQRRNLGWPHPDFATRLLRRATRPALCFTGTHGRRILPPD